MDDRSPYCWGTGIPETTVPESHTHSAPYLQSKLYFQVDFSRTTELIAFILGPLLGTVPRILRVDYTSM